MPSPIKLIAIDIDGTLLDSRWQLPEPNRSALGRAASRGIEIVLASGRRFPFAREACAGLSFPWTLIASNGAVVKTHTGRTIARNLLSAGTAAEVLEASGPARRAALLLFDCEGRGEIVTEDSASPHAPVAAYLERNREFLLEVERLEDALTTDVLQVMFAGAVEPMRELWQRLERATCRSRINIARTEYPERDLTMLDILDAGCDKGVALAEIAELRGLTPAEIMAIGDNWNDIEMLEFAGTAVVMGNGAPEIRREGWHRTGTNDEAGVAQAIQRFVLEPAG